MKKLFCHPSAKQKLIASALFFLFSLLLLWLMLGYPMPTSGLVHRKLEAERGRPHLPIVAQGVVRFTDPTTQEKYGGDRWTVGRRGDEFFLTTAQRAAGFLWDGWLGLDIPPEQPIYYFDVGFQQNFYSGGITERVTVVLCADPSVTRIELTQYDLPTEERNNEAAFQAAHGVTTACAETTPGSGVWVGQQAYSRVKENGAGWSICTQAHAYAADGALLYTAPNPS